MEESDAIGLANAKSALSLVSPPSPPLSQESLPSPPGERADGGEQQSPQQVMLPVRTLARFGVILCPLYFFMAVFYNYALRYTRASDAVTGSMTTPVWTLLLAVRFCISHPQSVP